MLRLVFWFFLLTNGILLAFRLGYLDSVLPQKSEPQRLARQLNPERIRLLGQDWAKTTVNAKLTAKPVSAPPPIVKKESKRIECMEIGDFPVAKSRQIERRLTALSLGGHRKRKNIEKPTRFMVYIPPQGGINGANKRVSKFRRLGVINYFIIKNKPELHGAISLGVFKSETGAKRHQANLKRKGLRDVRIGGRNWVTTKVVYQLRKTQESKMAALNKLMAKYPRQKIRACSK